MSKPTKPAAPDVHFKPKNNGAIRRIGPIAPREVPANKPARQGVKRSLYENK